MAKPISNAEIAARLDRHARLLEIAGESAFRARAYERVAETVRSYPEQLTGLAQEGRLREIPGVGEGIAASIAEIVSANRFTAHEEVVQRVPESLLELTAVPGVGPKTALRLFSLLAVTDLASLEAALVAGKIATAKGLGPRAENTIRTGLEAIQRRSGRTPLGVALPLARELVAAYEPGHARDTIALAGSARRWKETVGDLDFVLASEDFDTAARDLASLPMIETFERTSHRSARFSLGGEIAADLYFTSRGTLGSTMVRATGSAAHLSHLGQIGDASTEEEIYRARGLPWIPPELRSGDQEFKRWPEIASLVTVADVNGELHSHTTWSDGASSIAEMAEAAANRGYTFLGITDHSHGLGVAGGLDAQRLALQRAEIAELAAIDRSDITLLAGSEVEVHRDGSLDFSDADLNDLRVVVASLHSGLRQPREELTARLERVLENAHVDIIAHPSGRLIERREGGDFDWDRVFATAALTGTALEINADPARLDLNDRLAARAHAAGCLLVINCDAHHPSGFASIEFGIAVARKAWLKPNDILNCWPRAAVLEWLDNRRSTT